MSVGSSRARVQKFFRWLPCALPISGVVEGHERQAAFDEELIVLPKTGQIVLVAVDEEHGAARTPVDEDAIKIEPEFVTKPEAVVPLACEHCKPPVVDRVRFEGQFLLEEF